LEEIILLHILYFNKHFGIQFSLVIFDNYDILDDSLFVFRRISLFVRNQKTLLHSAKHHDYYLIIFGSKPLDATLRCLRSTLKPSFRQKEALIILIGNLKTVSTSPLLSLSNNSLSNASRRV